MKYFVLLMSLIGAINIALSQSMEQAKSSSNEDNVSQQFEVYSSDAVIVSIDSVQNEKAETDKEPDPDDFTPTEKDPEPNYSMLQANTVYPEIARRAGIQGKVIVRVLIGKDGKPKPGKVRIEDSSNEIFNQVTIDAIMKTTFTPAIQKGRPVDVWVSVPMVFKLRDTVIPKEPKLDDYIEVDKEPEPNYQMLKENLVYPEEARLAGLQGKVIVRVLIGKNGIPKPGKVKIEISSNEIFNQAAINAIMKTHFTPATQKGQPIEVPVTVPIVFRLK